MKLLLFSEFIASNNFFLFVIEKLHLVNPFTGLGQYLQGIPIQNTVDFIWGTESGIRTLPVSIFFAFLSCVGREQWVNLYLVLSLLLPFLFFIIALRIYKRVDIFVIFGAIFYSFNTWIINRLASGFWQLNIAYAFLPFFIVIPLTLSKRVHMVKESLFFWASIYSILASIVILGQPHFLLMISLFLILHMIKLILTKSFTVFKTMITFYFLSFLLFCLLNTYFFIPSIFSPEYTFTAPNQYFSLGSVLFNGTGATLFHVLQMSPLDFPFRELPMNTVEWIKFSQLGIVPLFFLLKKKKEWLYLVCVLCFIFLAKGLNTPFSGMSAILYAYNPLLHFFRDPQRFLGAIALFGSLIIANADKKLDISRWGFVGITICFLGIFLIANKHIVADKLQTVLTQTAIPNQYVAMQKYINTLQPNQRLLILPNINSYAGYPFFHDTPVPTATVYDMALPLTVPLADSSNYPDNYSSQMSSLVYNEFTKTYNTNLLPLLGIKYLLTDASITNPDSEKNIATTSGQKLMGLPMIASVKHIKNLNLFMDQHPMQLVTTEKPIFAIGNLQTILHIHEQGITRPVILLNQSINTNVLSNSILHGQDIFIDDPQPLMTLSAEELASKYAVDILQSVWDYDKSLANCEPYKMAYIVASGNLFTSGRCVISVSKVGLVTIPTDISKGTYKILLKAMDVGNSSTIALGINDTTIKKHIMTEQKLQWIDMGTQTITTNNTNVNIGILDKNGIVIDYLLFVPITTWNTKLKENAQVISQMKPVTMQTIQESQTNNNDISIGINTVSSNKTKYLTYRFSWGKWWTSDKPSVSFISDGYGMTFIAAKDAISSISYFPDIIYSICIIISIVVVVSLIIYVIWYLYHKKYSGKFRLFKGKS